MPETVTVRLDGKNVEVRAGISVAAAILNSEVARVRTSVTGQARAPLCGMGVCFECRATVNGVPHVRTCMIACTDGMEIETGG
jgi:sarcosine oxidase subunit alpha